MDDYVRMRGTVTFIGKLSNEEIEEYCKKKFDEYAKEPLTEVPDSWFYTFNKCFYDLGVQFIRIRNNLWFVEDVGTQELCYHCNLVPKKNDMCLQQYTFDCQYCTWDCDWVEVLEEELIDYYV